MFYENNHTGPFRPIWKSSYSFISIFFCVAIVLFFKLYFLDRMQSFWWLLAAILTVVLFVVGLNYTHRNWLHISARQFSRTLFAWSLILRLLVMVILYFVFKHFTGVPFEAGEGYDDHTYHILATDIAEAWKQGEFGIMKHISWVMGFSYSGYPAFCGGLYYLFTPLTIVARIANCIIGSIAVLLTYKIGKKLFGERIGRTAGILAMMFPYMIYFSATQHKDMLLTLLVLLVIYVVVKFISGEKGNTFETLIFFLSIISLFTFRTIVPVLIIVCILLTNVFYIRLNLSFVRLSKTIFLILLVSAGLVFVNKIGGKEASITRISGGIEHRDLKTTRWAMDRTAVAGYASRRLFTAISFPAPFVTLVKIPLDTTEAPIRPELYKMGATFVWNILSYFSLIGMSIAIIKRIKFTMPLWFFVVFYLFAIANMNLVMHDRHRLVVFPFLIVFAALGLHGIIQYRIKIHFWLIYLLIMAVTIFMWNYIRLAGRGMM